MQRAFVGVAKHAIETWLLPRRLSLVSDRWGPRLLPHRDDRFAPAVAALKLRADTPPQTFSGS